MTNLSSRVYFIKLDVKTVIFIYNHYYYPSLQKEMQAFVLL